MDRLIEKELSFAQLTIEMKQIGRDYEVSLRGGQKPHIGCTVLAIPRLSLSGDGSISATSSVLNVTGHKDETLCRYLAEKIASAKNAVVVCTGGFHMDHISKAQIDEVTDAVKAAAESLSCESDT